jgi:DNA topoisomerase-1
MNKTSTSPGRPLVIVESPNKVKTISKILGDEYNVHASVGHFADIPAKKGAIDVEGGFVATYHLSKKGEEIIAGLQRELKTASELILATDDDREGEMIAYLLLEFLQPTIPVSRIVFTAITKFDVLKALDNRQSIRYTLVEAARTRRYLDYLYGFNVSPVLWKKVRGNLSAGRVQSPALRLIVEREKQRLAFVETTYCSIESTLNIPTPVVATLRSIDATPVAKSTDINDAGVVAAPAELLLLDRAHELAQQLRPLSLVVTSSKTERYTRKPRPPYTTASLITDATNRLGLSGPAAQSIMNQLHEKGLISYPRTDSPSLSAVTTAAARQQAIDMFGAASVPEKSRPYSSNRKNAQEAHEAIRPANLSLRSPKGLTTQQAAVYDLVWRRTVASQMIDTVGTTVTVTFTATTKKPIHECVFTTSGTTITELGHRRLYINDDDDITTPIAEFSVGEKFSVKEIEVKEHVTKPPARYNDGSLISALEALEIGRPSTYASIIQSLRDEYVWSKSGDKAFIPTLTGIAVEKFLSECFPLLVDYTFTRNMESQLDDIVGGQASLVDVLESFYSTGSGAWPGLVTAVNDVVASYKPAEHNVWVVGVDPESGQDIVVKPGKTFAGKKSVRGSRTTRSRTSGSPYLSCSGRNAAVPDQTELAHLTVDYALSLLRANQEARVIGEIDGEEVTVKVGPYGPYVKVGKRSLSLDAEADLSAVTLGDVQELMAFPRVLGADPESGADIVLKRGRYGLYVDRDGDTRPLPKDSDVEKFTLADAIDLLARPKKGKRKG